MKTLLVDNYDSFSHILFQYLWEVNGIEPIFIRNDEWTLDRIRSTPFDNILISPGPGHPANLRDFGVCRDLIANFPQVPILGVCLGHQGLALLSGASVIRAPQVKHGKSSRILHTGTGLFAGLPPAFTAVRYHSLVVDPTTPSVDFTVTATAEEDGQIMAIAFRHRPHYGVQFHPESIGSETGKALLGNFRELTREHLRSFPRRPEIKPGPKIPPLRGSVAASAPPEDASLDIRELPWQDPEAVFHGLFAATSAAFWLDSLMPPVPGDRLISYMGSGRKLIEAQDHGLRIWTAAREGLDFKVQETIPGDPLDALQGYLGDTVSSGFPGAASGFHPAFKGGLVGYFGYGMKKHTGPNGIPEPSSQPKADAPDALFLQPDRILAFDHAAGKVFAWLPAGQTPPDEASLAWLRNLPSQWQAIVPQRLDLIQIGVPRAGSNPGGPEDLQLPVSLAADKAEYQGQILDLQASILSGESYEACLTNQAQVKAEADPWLVYRMLRRTNPAPYAAFFRFPQVTLLSASPERFLKLDGEGLLSSRPIKGTRRRGGSPGEDAGLKADLSHHPKDRSENLMIVDLVRNDFGKVCIPGTVQVPEFMVVEEHPTVFQLVSGVTGRLQPGQTAIDAVRACFPGGSMTGAPKLRTMELLAAQERRERGVFSGAMGYLGWDGSLDLGMVIRTLVHTPGIFSVGCGGAILAESDPEAEFAEAMLKAFAPLRAVELAVLGECGGWRQMPVNGYGNKAGT